MSKLQLLVLVFLLMLAARTQPACAAFVPIEVSIEPTSVKTDLNSRAVFLMSVRNNMNVQDNLKISVTGPHIHWATNPVILLVVPKNSTKEINITFYPVERRGTFDFGLDVTSYIHPDITEHRDIRIEIPPPLITGNFSVSESGSGVTASIDVETLSGMPVDVSFNITDEGGDTISSSHESRILKGAETFTSRLSMPENPTAGDYSVNYAVNGNITGYHVLTVDPVHRIERAEQLVATFMHGDVVLTFRNTGNVVERGYVVRESLPTDAITGFITRPSGCSEAFGMEECDYVLPDLEPGATAQITYRIEYWPAYVQMLSVVIIAAIIAGFMFVRATKPTVTKRSVRKGTHDHTVIIEIRNPFLHNLKDVVIRDWVSPLAKVVQEEARGLKPVMKRSDAGTELIWKLGEISPKEVRILSYKVKSLIEGNLKMPRAYARFRTPTGRRSRTYSKQLNLG
jgi:hypothetical protein